MALEYNAAGRTLDRRPVWPRPSTILRSLGRRCSGEYPLADYPDAGAAFGLAMPSLACPPVRERARLSKARTVYEYEFEQTPNQFVLPTAASLGAFHSSELPFRLAKSR